MGFFIGESVEENRKSKWFISTIIENGEERGIERDSCMVEQHTCLNSAVCPMWLLNHSFLLFAVQFHSLCMYLEAGTWKRGRSSQSTAGCRQHVESEVHFSIREFQFSVSMCLHW